MSCACLCQDGTLSRSWKRVNELISTHHIDLAIAGAGETNENKINTNTSWAQQVVWDG